MAVSLTAEATESILTYAEVIELTLINMKKRKENLHVLNWLHWNEWSYFHEYLKALQENFLRYLRALGKGHCLSTCLLSHVAGFNWRPSPGTIFFLSLFILREREGEWGGGAERERERESQAGAGCELSVQSPTQGLIPRTVR